MQVSYVWSNTCPPFVKLSVITDDIPLLPQISLGSNESVLCLRIYHRAKTHPRYSKIHIEPVLGLSRLFKQIYNDKEKWSLKDDTINKWQVESRCISAPNIVHLDGQTPKTNRCLNVVDIIELPESVANKNRAAK